MYSDIYINIKVIPSLVCGCKDAQKNTRKSIDQWLKGNYTIDSRNKLELKDILNTKYFIKENGGTGYK